MLEAREAAREENTRAFSHTRGHFRVSRVSLDGLRKKERLLVVSTIETKKGWPNFFPSFNPLPSIKTDDRKQFQCLTMVLHNNTGPLFLEFN